MIPPLDRKTRKTLVKIAEQNEEYRQATRIILALAAGQDENQVAELTHVSVQEVQDWAKRYTEENLSLFADVLPPDEVQAPEKPEEATPPPKPRQEKDHRRPRRQRSRKPSPPPPPPSVEDAVAEGLEDLLGDDEDLDAELPHRQVVTDRETPRSESSPVPEPAPEVQAGPVDSSKPISVGALANAFEVDMAHARHISQQARTLFDATATAHRLPDYYRDLLHAAALLHNIAFNIDPTSHHTRGRDLMMQYQIIDISPEERQLLAIMTALHRHMDSPAHEPLYQQLPDHLQHPAETLSALLRVGIGLDYSHSQTSHVIEWRAAPGELLIVVGGREAATDVPRAQQKSDLWNRLFSVAQMRFLTETEMQSEDYIANAPPPSPELNLLDTALQVSNKLRVHYTQRLDYLAARIRQGDPGLLVSLWREFQRLIGVWEWLIPGSRPHQLSPEDTRWLASTMQQALYSATLADRIGGILDEADPSTDDSEAIHELEHLHQYFTQVSQQAFSRLREALTSDRYIHWLAAVQTQIEGDGDFETFASQIAERSWAYLGELRQTIDRVKRAGWNADLESMLTIEVVNAFESDLRRLSDLMTYSGSLLSHELEQVLDVLEPLLTYIQVWQRTEKVAQIAAQAHQASYVPKASSLVWQVLQTLMRERADEMRWHLVEMWTPMDTANFRRALALVVAKP